MKTIIWIPFLMLFSVALQAQEKKADKTLRTIAITGKAIKEIEPNLLYFSITLKEYQTKVGSKISINELERQLQNAVKKAKIDEKNLTVENVYGYNYSYWKQKQNNDFMSRKRYQLKLKDASFLDAILNQLDPKGIENARIKQYTHSDIEKMKEELQIEALLNAKSQAEKLVGAIDSELGQVIEIQENTQGYQPVYYYQSNAANNRMMAMESNMNSSDVEFKNIKLEAEIHVVFQIK